MELNVSEDQVGLKGDKNGRVSLRPIPAALAGYEDPVDRRTQATGACDSVTPMWATWQAPSHPPYWW